MSRPLLPLLAVLLLPVASSTLTGVDGIQTVSPINVAPGENATVDIEDYFPFETAVIASDHRIEGTAMTFEWEHDVVGPNGTDLWGAMTVTSSGLEDTTTYLTFTIPRRIFCQRNLALDQFNGWRKTNNGTWQQLPTTVYNKTETSIVYRTRTEEHGLLAPGHEHTEGKDPKIGGTCPDDYIIEAEESSTQPTDAAANDRGFLAQLWARVTALF